MSLRFIDTNVLLYSISTDRRESKKRDIAVALLDEDNLALSVQVLQEFYVQATRASRTDPLPHELASGLIRTWLRFRVQEITIAVMQAALEFKAKHKFSYWDSTILAAAQALGCTQVLTEDMAHGRDVEGMLINNPFR